MGRTILVTGSEGYLASDLIDKLFVRSDVGRVIGVDIRESSERAARDPRYRYIQASVTDPTLSEQLSEEEIDDAVHTAWTFNPTHDSKMRDEVDIQGTRNMLNIVRHLEIPHFFYLGSTTAYGHLASNPWEPPFLSEDDWQTDADLRLRTDYPYSRNKAIVDQMIQRFALTYPDIIVGWIRGSIVIGPKTRNVVSYVAESRFTFGRYMFRVKGPDPPMQFISEEDMSEVLYRATIERWQGPVNVAGEGTVLCSELIEAMGRREMVLSDKILYPTVSMLWKARVLDFPASLLDLIRYPWVADISRLKNKFGFTPKYTSREALAQFAQSRMGR